MLKSLQTAHKKSHKRFHLWDEITGGDGGIRTHVPRKR